MLATPPDEERLAALLVTWQKRLRLSDWVVTVEIKRARDMQNERANGEVEMIESQRRAWIYLRDPLDVLPEYHTENDLEQALVHELLHLMTEPFGLPDDGPKSIAEEQMLNAVAAALVALDRYERVGCLPHKTTE